MAKPGETRDTTAPGSGSESRSDPRPAPGRGPSPRDPDYRVLLAKCHNRCAFTGCTHQVVNDRQDFIGEVCHIEAASPEGPRFNPKMTDEQRRAEPNLIIMCHAHHVEVDRHEEEFTVIVLRDLKTMHEAGTGAMPQINESLLRQVRGDAERYWTRVQQVSDARVLGVEINTRVGFPTILREIRGFAQALEQVGYRLARSSENIIPELAELAGRHGHDLSWFFDVPYPENRQFQYRNWEEINLALPNLATRILTLTHQAEVHYWHLRHEREPESVAIKRRLDASRRRLLRIAKKATLVD
ncbi:hypothetical protein L6V77_26655 [Myxococcota bacterium]|nr:hypothetical protein [Myxococcota bacterium]